MSDSWSLRLPETLRYPLSLGLPALQFHVNLYQDLQAVTPPFSSPAADQYTAITAAAAPALDRPALGLRVPLESVGGVTCFRPARAVPLVLSGSTLPLDTLGIDPGVGVGLSFRFDNLGHFGLFASVTNAPVVGSLSLGYSPHGYTPPGGTP